MRKFSKLSIILPIFISASTWHITNGIGYGQHKSLENTQSQWNNIGSIETPLYEGLNGRLSYNICGGPYDSDTIRDDNLAIDFRAYVIKYQMRLGVGLGLGVNHRGNITEDLTLNQSFIPLNIDIQPNVGSFSNFKLGLQTDYYVHPPNTEFLNGFNTLSFRVTGSIHYFYRSIEIVSLYQNASFTEDSGINGINTSRIEVQAIYHFKTI